MPSPGAAFRDCPDCPEMVVIPAGKFMMGAAPDFVARLPTEEPYHPVTIARPFALGRFEITRAQFAAFARETGYAVEPGCVFWNLERRNWDNDPKRTWQAPGFSQGDDHPVVCVPWIAARAYVEWLARRTARPYRLPSEAEWEYAARAGASARWYWGDRLAQACEYANLSDAAAKAAYAHWNTFGCDDRYPYTAPAGSFKPNAFGLHDVIGNAWEWTEDCWNESYQGAPLDGSPWLQGNCGKRVARGNAWLTGTSFSRVTFRLDNTVGHRMVHFGIRVARDL